MSDKTNGFYREIIIKPDNCKKTMIKILLALLIVLVTGCVSSSPSKRFSKIRTVSRHTQKVSPLEKGMRDLAMKFSQKIRSIKNHSKRLIIEEFTETPTQQTKTLSTELRNSFEKYLVQLSEKGRYSILAKDVKKYSSIAGTSINTPDYLLRGDLRPTWLYFLRVFI